MSKNCTLEEIAALLLAQDKLVLCPHVSPDGDALGSTLALKMALEKAGKKVTVMVDDAVMVDDDVPKAFGFLPQIDCFVKPAGGEVVEADLLVVLDASSLDRIGKVAQAVKAKAVANIDHHISNTQFADYLYLNTEAAATAEILCNLVEKLGITPDKDLATCLYTGIYYTGIYTDCGSFRYANTTPGTMRAAAKLLEYGARPNEISDALGTNTRANIEMLGKVLQTLAFYNDGKISTLEINSDLYDKDVNTDNFISFARYIEGVDVAVLFKAVEPAVTRVSMRSQETDVAAIALSFGGGGHVRAAGCTVELPLEQAKAKVLEAIGKAL